MQGPERNISYFDDLFPSKLLLYCRPVSPYNVPISSYLPFLVLAPPSKWRKSALIILLSFALLKQMHIPSDHRSHLCLHGTSFFVASQHFRL